MLRKVMVIDDAEQTRADAEAGLQLIGAWDAVSVKCDLAAVGVALREFPDLILLDAGPAGEGLEILRGLRAHEALSEVPVVLLTLESAPRCTPYYLRAGAAGVIEKPFDPRSMPVLLFGVLGALELAPLAF